MGESNLKTIKIGDDMELTFDTAEYERHEREMYGDLIDIAVPLDDEDLFEYIDRQLEHYPEELQREAIRFAGISSFISWQSIIALEDSRQGRLDSLSLRIYPIDDNPILLQLSSGEITTEEALRKIDEGDRLVMERKLANHLIVSGRKLSHLLRDDMAKKIQAEQELLKEIILGKRNLEDAGLAAKARILKEQIKIKGISALIGEELTVDMVDELVREIVTPRFAGLTMDIMIDLVEEIVMMLPDEIDPTDFFATTVGVPAAFGDFGVYPFLKFKETADHTDSIPDRIME